MNFQDIATRILDGLRVKAIKETVSTLPEEQQIMVDYYGSNLPLKLANYEGEKWYKFWMMGDGTIIPVKFAHVNTSSEAFEGSGYYFDPYSSLIESGAIRGHIDPSNNEISIEFNDLPTSGQIDSLKKLIIKYSVKKIVTDDYGAMDLKSPDHLEYLIMYGPVSEKKLVKEAVSTLPEEQQVMVDYYGSDLPLKLANYGGEKWYKFWMMGDGTVIPVETAHLTTVRHAFKDYGYKSGAYDSLLISGAIRGHVDPSTKELSIEFNTKPTNDQINSLKRIITKYSVKQVVTNEYGTMELKSPEHLEYLITYGPVEEKKLDEDAGPAPAGPAPSAQPASGTTEDHISYLPTRLGEKGWKRRRRKRKKVKEAVATITLPEVQQKLVNKRGTTDKLEKSSYPGEKWYKFWMMNDGSLVPVKIDHGSTAFISGESVNHDSVMDSGGIRGHIDGSGGLMAFQFSVKPNDTQIETLKKLAAKYRVNQMAMEDWDYSVEHESGRVGYSGKLKSPDHLEHIIRYGPKGMDEKMIREAVSVDLKRLRSELKKELIKLFNDEAFLLMVNHYDVWRSTFGVKSHRTAKVAVTIENSERDIQRLYGQLLREYGDSKGNLEMLIAAIQDRRPLGQFDVFNKFNNLFGTRVESVFGGVTLVFEGTIDFIYDSSESVYIEDDEVLDSVEEMFGRIIKRSRKLIYPVGGKFRVGFFNGLKNLIASSDDKMENTDEEV